MKGFTLLELLVVLTILALASGGVVMALRDHDGQRVQQEAQRLAALLEAGRAESRVSGIPIHWQIENGGFSFTAAQPARRWLYAETHAHMERPGSAPPNTPERLTLGPEPIIAAQQVTVVLGQHRMRVATDGLQPFSVVADDLP